MSRSSRDSERGWCGVARERKRGTLQRSKRQRFGLMIKGENKEEEMHCAITQVYMEGKIPERINVHFQ